MAGPLSWWNRLMKSEESVEKHELSQNKRVRPLLMGRGNIHLFTEAASALRTEKSYLKFKLILSGKTLNYHKDFITHLKQRVDLKEVNTEDECDFILGFCPIVSRAGTDIEAAMKHLHNISDTKPVVLVVLHHTFDPECVVPDSIKCVNRKNMIAVDCLFHEDKGLLQCLKNNESLDKTSQYLKGLLYIKCENMKRQKEGERSGPKNNARSIEKEVTGLEGTNMKPDQTTNVSEESENSQPERNQQLNPEHIGIDIVEDMEQRNESHEKITRQKLNLLKDHLTENRQTLQKKDKTLEEKENQLKQTRAELDKKIKELEDSQRHVEQQKSELAEKNQQLEEKDRLLTERETQLMGRDKELQEKDKTLEEKEKQLKQTRAERDKTIKELEDSQRHVEQQKSELAEKNQQLEEKERLLTERETQLMGRDKELQEKDRLLAKTRQKLEIKDETLKQKGTQLFQGKEQEEQHSNQGIEELLETKPHLELKTNLLVKKDQQEEEIKRQQEIEITDVKNNEHLTQEKGSMSITTNSQLEKNRSPYEGYQQAVLEKTQIQESQPAGEEREIKYVEKNKETIGENELQKVRGIELRETETVHKAGAMLMENKEQLKNFTENQQSDVEESNQTEPETQEEKSDKQHNEKDRPRLGKRKLGENNQGSVGDTGGEERE